MTSTLYNIGSDIYSYFVNDTTSKDGQILEPLSCIIKLGILCLKTDGTKLQIINNSIKFQTPTIFQGPSRWINGDNRNDLHNLSNPIQISIEWYNPQTSSDLEYLYRKSLDGLDKLSESYNTKNVSSLVANTIEHYRCLITSSLDNKNNITSTIDEHNNIYKELWTENEISIIKNLLEISIIKKAGNELFENYICSIESILDDKDEQIRNIIYKNNTKI